MPRKIVKILIAILLLAPFVSQAGFLAVTTGDATGVTNTSATLHGYGGDADPNSTMPVTGYFRYSTAKVAPIFCNDIYGTQMVATGDISLGSDGTWKSFSQNIYNLAPDTTYYYCAIVSDKNNIAYGSESRVKEFHTACYQTTINTLDATNVQSTSANLKGSYCSTQSSVKTSFNYREAKPGETPPPWKEVASTSHAKGSGSSNVYGNITFLLTSLAPNTTYQFKAVAVDQGTSKATTEGSILNFTTLPGVTGGGSGGSTQSNSGTSGVTTNNGSTVTTGVGFGFTNTGGNKNNSGNSNGNNGGIFTGNLQLGQTATPPGLALVRFHEGVETVFARQIMSNTDLARAYGYQAGMDLQTFAWDLADQLAKIFGYVSPSGKEIRVSQPDIAAYQLVYTGNRLTVYEYYNGKIVDIQSATSTLKNASGYEYYFNK